MQDQYDGQMGTLAVTGDHDADQLLIDDPFALLLAMMLDQQIPMEWAFKSPLRLKERIPDDFSAERLAALDPEKAEAAFKEKPALHRFPGSMARRAQELARHIVDHHDGNAAQVWTEATTGQEALGPAQGPPRLRRREGQDLPRRPRQALQRHPRRLGVRRRPLLRPHPPLRRRHRQPRSLGRGKSLEKSPKSQRQEQTGLITAIFSRLTPPI